MVMAIQHVYKQPEIALSIRRVTYQFSLVGIKGAQRYGPFLDISTACLLRTFRQDLPPVP
jgi:hypothetical protein